jgi:hypothetical protein
MLRFWQFAAVLNVAVVAMLKPALASLPPPQQFYTRTGRSRKEQGRVSHTGV